MAEKDTIDISSSDSDSTWDLAHYKDYSPSREVTSSINPSSPLAVISGTSLNKQELLHQRDSATNPRMLPSGASPSGMSLGGNHGLPLKVPYTHKMPAPNGSSSSLILSRTSYRGSSSNTDQDNYSKYSTGNDHARHSSQQTSKGTLSASLQSSVPSPRSSSLVENVSSSEIREVHGMPSYLEKPYFNNDRNYTLDLSARFEKA